MKRISSRVVIIILALFFTSGCSYAASVYDLTVEMEKNPIGLDTSKPRFSWKVKAESGIFGQKQTAYRILIATSESKLKEGITDVWDSKKVKSDQSVLVDCLPSPLKGHTDYYWTVTLWDENGIPGTYAAPEQFSIGYLSQEEWNKNDAIWIESSVEPWHSPSVDAWIKYATVAIQATLDDDTPYTTINELTGKIFSFSSNRKLVNKETVEKSIELSSQRMRDVWPGSLLRKEFDAGNIKKARLFVCGLGYYRAYLNGTKIGARVLAPSDSHYSSTTYYNVYDVTNLVKSNNKNCIGVELVNGRWNSNPGCEWQMYYKQPVMIARLELTDASGNIKTVVSDTSWQSGKHGIVKSNFWIGQLYDDNLYPYGWNLVSFDATTWKNARRAGKVPGGEMVRDPLPAERIVEYHNPVKVSEPMPKVYVYDFGKQIVGRAKFTFRGLKKGQNIAFRYSETKPFDSPNPATYVLGYYPSFENTTQHKEMLLFKRRGSVAAHPYNLYYADSTGQRKMLNDYEMAGQLLYTDMYVASGKEEEIFQPDFSYVGFRYLEILGLDNSKVIKDVQAFSMRTDPQFVGSMTTDNSKLNKVLSGSQGSLMGNFHSNLQDNPGAERNSFIINEGFNIENSAYWFNMYPQLKKVMINVLTLNKAWNFYVAVPNSRNLIWAQNKYFHLSSSLAYPSIAAGMIGFYNDRRLGEKFALQLVDFVTEISDKTYWNHDLYEGSGDHQAESTLYIYKNQNSKKLSASNPLEVKGSDEVTYRPYFKAAWILYTAVESEIILRDLGYKNEADIIAQKRNAFCDRIIRETDLYDAEKKLWNSRAFTRMGTNILAILGDLKQRRPDPVLLEETAKEIQDLGYITTGVKMTYNLLHVLSQNGYSDLVAQVLQREDYPGLLHLMKTTKNTLPEGWDLGHSFTQVEGLAAVGRWYYCDLVGIKPDLKAPAFKRFTLKPIVPEAVKKFDFTYDSPRGVIESHWDENDGYVHWRITVPPNSVAEVQVPTSGKLKQMKGMKFVESQTYRQLYEFSSGEYVFSFKKNTMKNEERNFHLK